VGVWLDEGELARVVAEETEKFSEDLVREVVGHAFSGLPAAKAAGEKSGACPKCRKAMRLLNYSYDSGVIIDRCTDGHGVWLDGGEIEKIQAYTEQWKKDAPKHREDWTALLRHVEKVPDPAAEVVKRLDHSTFMFRQFLRIFLD
jgi:Zn-finger nucleic acid-binding protein